MTSFNWVDFSPPCYYESRIVFEEYEKKIRLGFKDLSVHDCGGSLAVFSLGFGTHTLLGKPALGSLPRATHLCLESSPYCSVCVNLDPCGLKVVGFS